MCLDQNPAYEIRCCVWSSYVCYVVLDLCFFKQKTAYEMRISDWSSDVCSSDLSMCRRQQQGDACRSKRQHRKPAYSMGGTISGICGDHEKDQIGRASCRERVCQYV